MECVHIIHRDKYNGTADQWFRTAFRNNRGSLSILSTDCIADHGRSICGHIREFYGQWRRIVSEPPIFWRFDTAILPQGGRLAQEGDDICHQVVEGLSDDALWPVFENVPISDLSICTNGDFRPLTRADLPSPVK